jgi:hypothetical protein
MLVFSKEKGKLARKLKLTDAVPPKQDSDFLCAVPIIRVQPALDEDSIVVMAPNDINIAESIGLLEDINKLNRHGKTQEADELRDTFITARRGVQWYRVSLDKGKTEKMVSLDVPSESPDFYLPREWDMELAPPIFIPLEHGRILFGGYEKSYRELIGTVFVKAKPVEDVKGKEPEGKKSNDAKPQSKDSNLE